MTNEHYEKNMEIWNKAKQPPASALKEIKGGRLKGMSDINPQWRFQVMTEIFGSCGIGWKYTIERTWTERGSEGQVAAFAEISLYTVNSIGDWGYPVPGIGGSMFISNEKNGQYTNDEAFKMALTDALGVAMKALGVAADIYAGKWDGSKYTGSTTVSEPDPTSPMTKEMKKKIVAQFNKFGIKDNDKIKTAMQVFKDDYCDGNELTIGDYSKFILRMGGICDQLFRKITEEDVKEEFGIEK